MNIPIAAEAAPTIVVW